MMPDTIGRYRIDGELGRGAMGTVFRAHDPEIDRTVAIKLIRADLLEGEARADYVQRFRQEAQAAARCVHPSIVAIYDFATTGDGNPFLAMEFVPGRPLREPGTPARQMAVGACVSLVRQLLSALACAHSVGVVHRDIKPANLLVLPDGRLKVTDFGISRIDSSELTAVGSLIGTPSYMSPEQCRGDIVDARSDLFSAAVVMFELLSGVRPFAGGATETMRRLLDAEPPDLAPLGPEVPRALAAFLGRALAKPVERRFQNAAEMAAGLEQAASANDATVLAPALDAGQTNFVLPPAVQTRLEAKLAAMIGPIARHVLRDAAARADSVEAFVDLACNAIADGARRAAFAREAAAVLRGEPSLSGTIAASPAGAVPAEQVARIERDLVRILGPIASVLVRRALPAADSAVALRNALGVHIERPDERAMFLRAG